MPINQQLTQDTDIKKFKKKFFKKYGMHLYVYSAGHHDYRVALGVFEDCTLIALKKNNPKYSYMNDLKYKLRERPYLVYTQAMAYLAHIGGHPKSKIGQHINKKPMLNDALNNILKEIENHVGIIPEDITSKLNSQSNVDPIWDKARRFIAKHN